MADGAHYYLLLCSIVLRLPQRLAVCCCRWHQAATIGSSSRPPPIGRDFRFKRMQLLLHIMMMLRLIALVAITLLWMLRVLLEQLLCHLLAQRQLLPMIMAVHMIRLF
jgi:hypothetical protein